MFENCTALHSELDLTHTVTLAACCLLSLLTSSALSTYYVDSTISTNRELSVNLLWYVNLSELHCFSRDSMKDILIEYPLLFFSLLEGWSYLFLTSIERVHKIRCSPTAPSDSYFIFWFFKWMDRKTYSCIRNWCLGFGIDRWPC